MVKNENKITKACPIVEVRRPFFLVCNYVSTVRILEVLSKSSFLQNKHKFTNLNVKMTFKNIYYENNFLK